MAILGPQMTDDRHTDCFTPASGLLPGSGQSPGSGCLVPGIPWLAITDLQGPLVNRKYLSSGPGYAHANYSR
jgi:hypothetical protein